MKVPTTRLTLTGYLQR